MLTCYLFFVFKFYILFFYYFFFFFFNDTATTEIYTLSLHDALPFPGSGRHLHRSHPLDPLVEGVRGPGRSEEHTSGLQSRRELVCRLLLEKKNRQSKGAFDTSSIRRTPRSAARLCSSHGSSAASCCSTARSLTQDRNRSLVCYALLGPAGASPFPYTTLCR